MAKNKKSVKPPTLELNPDRSRPTADFNDPVMCAQDYKIDHVGLNAYGDAAVYQGAQGRLGCGTRCKPSPMSLSSDTGGGVVNWE